MYKTFASIRTEFLVLFILILGVVQPAMAANALFTVEDVTVDVTAENALKAREQAFNEAQVKAFETLASRMLTEAQLQTFAAPEPATISTMIQDFEVTKEQLSAVRYVGTYTFRFQDSAVRQYFGGNNMSYTDVSSRPVLVIPFYRRGERPILWSPYNFWMSAWSRAEGLQNGVVPLIAPLGDLTDARDIDDNDALQYQQAKLNNMVRRYGAAEAVLLVAVPEYGLTEAESENDPASGQLTVEIYRTDRQGAELTQQTAVQAYGGETVGQFMDRAVQEVRRALQQDWKAQTAVRSSETGTVRARVPISGLQQWAETQSALRKVYGLKDIKIVSITPGEAQVDLVYQGDEQRLRIALKQADLVLSGAEGNTATFSNGRYDRGSLSPQIYDLYLSKYAPNDLKPFYKREASTNDPKPDAMRIPDMDSVPDSLQTPQTQMPEYMQPEAGRYDQDAYEAIRRQYRNRF